MYFWFSVIFSFLAIFQVLQCAFLIFHVFQWFRHFASSQVDVSHFPWFSVFLPYSMSYSGHFSFSTFFSFSRHSSRPKGFISHDPHFQLSWPIAGPTVCISHFSCFSIFVVIFHYLTSVSLIFREFQFFCHIPCPTVDISKFYNFFSFSRHISRPKVCISHFPWFSVFSPYFRSYSVHF